MIETLKDKKTCWMYDKAKYKNIRKHFWITFSLVPRVSYLVIKISYQEKCWNLELIKWIFLFEHILILINCWCLDKMFLNWIMIKKSREKMCLLVLNMKIPKLDPFGKSWFIYIGIFINFSKQLQVQDFYYFCFNLTVEV